MSAIELLAELRRLNPGVRFARYSTDSAVGEWIPSAERFAPVFEAYIDGRWIPTIVETEGGRMIRETMVNGKSVYDPAKWIE